jgi:tRNA threonylcarbamoyladenosine biosynthesis protein TsaE
MAPEPVTRTFLSHTPEATAALGEALGRAAPAGLVLALSGDLGSGKTTLVAGLARGLGVVERASSPTFTLMQEHRGRLPFFHFDAWMAGREALFLEGGGAEYLTGEGVAAVEWAERVLEHLPVPRLDLTLAHRSPEVRWLRLELVRAPAGEAGGTLESALEGLLRDLEPPQGLEELSDTAGEPGPGSPVGGEA